MYPLVTAQELESTLDEVLVLLAERRGTDFRRYRRAMVERRVQGRMRKVRTTEYARYLRLLRTSDPELDHLIAHITIKVSQFYRVAKAFDAVRRVLPELGRAAFPGPLRIWSAGCGQGEEAYTLALLLAEAEARGAAPGGRVIATDIDGMALDTARQGRYPAAALAELPPELASLGLIVAGDSATAMPSLRERVRLLRHDLLGAASSPLGPPFHLVTCRNVLIYFDRSEQERVQRLLCDSLRPGGYMLLGEAEALAPALRSALEAVDPQARLFRRRDAC